MVWLAGTVLAVVIALGGFLVWEAVRLSADGRALRSGVWLALGLGALVLGVLPVYGYVIDMLPLARQCIGWGLPAWVGTAGTTVTLGYGAVGAAGVVILGGAGVTALATRRGPLTWAEDAWARAVWPLAVAGGVASSFALFPLFGLPVLPLFAGGWPVVAAVLFGVIPNVLAAVRSPGDGEGAEATARDLAAHRLRVGIASTLGAMLVCVGVLGMDLLGQIALPGAGLVAGVIAASTVVGGSALGSVLAQRDRRGLRHGGALVGILTAVGVGVVLASSLVFTSVYAWAGSTEVDCSDPAAHGLVHRPLEDIDVWE